MTASFYNTRCFAENVNLLYCTQSRRIPNRKTDIYYQRDRRLKGILMEGFTEPHQAGVQSKVAVHSITGIRGHQRASGAGWRVDFLLEAGSPPQEALVRQRSLNE